MREENLKALREKIQASFERARVEAPAPKKMSDDQRLVQQQTYRGAVPGRCKSGARDSIVPALSPHRQQSHRFQFFVRLDSSTNLRARRQMLLPRNFAIEARAEKD